jgi:hypothetical protein
MFPGGNLFRTINLARKYEKENEVAKNQRPDFPISSMNLPLMVIQRRQFGRNLPLGVQIMTPGGFKGYSFGKSNFP